MYMFVVLPILFSQVLGYYLNIDKDSCLPYHLNLRRAPISRRGLSQNLQSFSTIKFRVIFRALVRQHWEHHA